MLPPVKTDFICGISRVDECTLYFCLNEKHYYQILVGNSIYFSCAFLCERSVKYFKAEGFILKKILDQSKDMSSDNKCSSCKDFFQFSETNQDNGTFICFTCRTYPFYK